MNWLDLKLGGRMLVKYPGLTVVGGLAMAFAICVAIVIYEVSSLFLYPSLPLVDANRVVKLSLQDVSANVAEPKALFEFTSWRETLSSVTDLGAWRESTRNLIGADGDSRPVYAAEMTASGFRVGEGEPLLGRVLTTDDEQPAAPPVAVIGHELWASRFGSDPNVLGRSVQLGNDHVTIVGVMRPGFAFPVSQEMWLPLKTAILDQAPRSGPAISMFGKLAPGVSMDTAQAELTTLGRRAAAAQPRTHQNLEPRVQPYAQMIGGDDLTIMFSIYFFISLLIVLICGNVGLLLFARAATRENDLIVRVALGANRSRIVSQMFAEALVLGSAAAVVGLLAANLALRNWGMTFLETNLGRLPFWFNVSLSWETILLTIVLTVMAATVAGVMPALKLTRGMGDRLKQTTAGSGGLRFGGVWSVVIIAQVAVTVVFPCMVALEQFLMRRVETFDPGFATDQYLAVQVERDYPVDGNQDPAVATLERKTKMTATLDELQRRVASQPGVAGVTFVQSLPTSDHPQRYIEMGYDATEKPATGADAPLRIATIAQIEPSYFDVLGEPILAGRAFSGADVKAGARVAIVDHGFVDQVLRGRNPIGQQVRYTRPGNPDGPSEWFEVVGLVKELGVGAPYQRGRAAGFYVPGSPAEFNETYMMVRVRGGDPLTIAPELREAAAAVDPSLRLVGIQRLNELNAGIGWVMSMWTKITIVMSSLALLLSLAGLFAVMSFTVSRRTREIGVRVALGGSRQRILASVFRRPLTQMSIGILAGSAIVIFAASMWQNTELPGPEGGLSWQAYGMLVGYCVLMLGVCMLACVVPTRRALAVEPTVALRTE